MFLGGDRAAKFQFLAAVTDLDIQLVQQRLLAVKGGFATRLTNNFQQALGPTYFAR